MAEFAPTRRHWLKFTFQISCRAEGKPNEREGRRLTFPPALTVPRVLFFPLSEFPSVLHVSRLVSSRLPPAKSSANFIERPRHEKNAAREVVTTRAEFSKLVRDVIPCVHRF